MSKKTKEVVEKSKEEESELEKEEEETTEEKTADDTEDSTESEEETEEESDDGDSSSKEIDYKAIAEAEKKKRKVAESLIAHDKFKKKHSKDEDGDDEDLDDEDKPITKRELAKLMEANSRSSQKVIYAERIDDISKDISDSDDESEAIKAVYANRNWSDDVSLRQQLLESKAIVNMGKTKSRMSELKRAAMSKDNRSNDGSDTQRDAQRGTAPKLSKADESAILSAGYKFDTKLRLYAKKLPNGKTLYKDTKNKKSWVK